MACRIFSVGQEPDPPKKWNLSFRRARLPACRISVGQEPDPPKNEISHFGGQAFWRAEFCFSA